MNLEKENNLLKKKLDLARSFIVREISSSVKNIDKNKKFFVNNIKDKIFSYFGENLLFSANSDFLDYLISAELSFYNLENFENLDGISALISYQKALYLIIEKNIISLFRSFVKPQKINLKKNNLIEKNLHSVIEKSYNLGFNRLFQIISKIKNKETLYDYGKSFSDFLEKYDYIGKIILNDDFIVLAEKLANSGILGEKRHIGKVNLQELKFARNILIGDFKDRNSLIYKILEIGKIDL